MSNNKGNFLETILAIILGYTLVGSLSSDNGSVLSSTLDSTGGSLDTSVKAPLDTSTYSIGGAGITGGIFLAGTTTGSVQWPIGNVNGHQIMKNGFGDIYTENYKNYELVEKRATYVYDTLHKGHVKKEKVTGLIVPNPEVEKEMSKLLKIEDKKKLCYRLEALRRVLEEIEEENKEKEEEAAKLTKNIK